MVSDLERSMIAVWRIELATVQRLLEDIEQGRTQRPIKPHEIEELKRDAERFAGLIAAYEAEDGA